MSDAARETLSAEGEEQQFAYFIGPSLISNKVGVLLLFLPLSPMHDALPLASNSGLFKKSHLVTSSCYFTP